MLVAKLLLGRYTPPGAPRSAPQAAFYGYLLPTADSTNPALSQPHLYYQLADLDILFLHTTPGQIKSRLPELYRRKFLLRDPSTGGEFLHAKALQETIRSWGSPSLMPLQEFCGLSQEELAEGRGDAILAGCRDLVRDEVLVQEVEMNFTVGETPQGPVPGSPSNRSFMPSSQPPPPSSRHSPGPNGYPDHPMPQGKHDPSPSSPSRSSSSSQIKVAHGDSSMLSREEEMSRWQGQQTHPHHPSRDPSIPGTQGSSTIHPHMSDPHGPTYRSSSSPIPHQQQPPTSSSVTHPRSRTSDGKVGPSGPPGGHPPEYGQAPHYLQQHPHHPHPSRPSKYPPRVVPAPANGRGADDAQEGGVHPSNPISHLTTPSQSSSGSSSPTRPSQLAERRGTNRQISPIHTQTDPSVRAMGHSGSEDGGQGNDSQGSTKGQMTSQGTRTASGDQEASRYDPTTGAPVGFKPSPSSSSPISGSASSGGVGARSSTSGKSSSSTNQAGSSTANPVVTEFSRGGGTRRQFLSFFEQLFDQAESVRTLRLQMEEQVRAGNILLEKRRRELGMESSVRRMVETLAARVQQLEEMLRQQRIALAQGSRPRDPSISPSETSKTSENSAILVGSEGEGNSLTRSKEGDTRKEADRVEDNGEVREERKRKETDQDENSEQGKGGEEEERKRRKEHKEAPIRKEHSAHPIPLDKDSTQEETSLSSETLTKDTMKNHEEETEEEAKDEVLEEGQVDSPSAFPLDPKGNRKDKEIPSDENEDERQIQEEEEDRDQEMKEATASSSIKPNGDHDKIGALPSPITSSKDED